MEVIRFNDEDGTIRVINPIYVKTVKFVHSEYNKDWCIVLTIQGQAGDNEMLTRTYKSEEEAREALEYISGCLKSIGKN